MAIVYDGIVHKKDSAGEWQDIDNRMAEFARGKSNVYATADGRVSFNKELNQKGKTIYDINDGHYQVTVSLDESSINSASVKLSNHSAKYMPSASDSMDVQYNKIKEIDNNTILLYNEVMQGVSFEYILSANDVKENIIINKPTSKYEYSFIYELSGLEAMLADTGDVLLCDEVSGAIVYEIPAPFMFDSNNAVSNEVAYELKELQKGTYQLTVTANPDWLNDESRVYPVVIDPTLNFRAAVSDTYIDYSNPDTNYGRAADLWVSNSKVTYLTSGLLPTLADNMTITHAEMTVYYEYHITSGYLDLGLYVCNQPWIFSSLTWNSANGYSHLGTFESSLATARAQASTTSSISTVTFDVTKAYQAWFAGLPYYGVALKRVGGTNYSVIIKAAEAGTATRAMCVLEYTLEDDLPLEEGTYFFENAKLGKYMQIDDNSNPSDVGAFLELWEFDGELYQQWDITYLHNGYYRISSKASGLSLKPPSSLNQSITQENLDYFDESFYWSVVKQSNGCYKISPKAHSAYYMAAGFGLLVQNGRNVEMRSNVLDQKDEWNILPVNTFIYCSFDTRVFYDNLTQETEESIRQAYNEATEAFATNFFIEFSDPIIELSDSFFLDSGCSVASANGICNSNCGAENRCKTLHHHSSERLLGLLKSNTTFTYRLVGYRLCYYDGSHYEVIGLGNVNGKNSITSTLSTSSLKRSIQHELTHNLGGTHENCTPNQDCVLKGDFNKWCDNCREAIKNNYQ